MLRVLSVRNDCSASCSPKHLSLVAVASALGFVKEFLEEEPVINDEDVVEDFLPLFLSA